MSNASRTVLVVDDESRVRDLTRRALLAMGFECDAAADGEEAFHLVGSKVYDAVVTDLRMPRRHGHALCGDLLKLPLPPNVMVLTGLTDARIVRDLMGRGVYDVLQKPVNYDVLASKVEAMIRNGRRTLPAPVPKARKTLKKTNLLHQIEITLVELTDLCGERLDTVFECDSELCDPPRSVQNYIRRLAETEAIDEARKNAVVLPGHEARTNDRVTCYTTVLATPVDRTWKPLDEPFKLALRDLSEGGARLLHTRAVNSEYVALAWNATQLIAKQIRVVCRIRRCKPSGPFYDLGGQFVMAD